MIAADGMGVGSNGSAGPLPAGPFGVVLADVPWTYSVFSKKGEGRSASRHYPTMSLDDICALPVAQAAAPDCHLFFWTTSPNLPQAFQVIDAWGFRYSSMAFTWVKLTKRAPQLFYDGRSFHVGMGHTTRKNAEFCLLGRRGSPKRLRKDIRELIISPVREHSRKPDEVHERIEAYSAGPYLELFARAPRAGWTIWGNQTDRFPEAYPIPTTEGN